MNADEFVHQLLECQPSIEALFRRVFRPAAAQRTVDGYKFLPKPEQVWREDALVDLVTNYDGTKVHIGVIGFLTMPIPTVSGRWHVAMFEADPIFVEAQSGGVTVFELGEVNFKLWDAASSVRPSWTPS